jgi:hypothetical protein
LTNLIKIESKIVIYYKNNKNNMYIFSLFYFSQRKLNKFYQKGINKNIYLLNNRFWIINLKNKWYYIKKQLYLKVIENSIGIFNLYFYLYWMNIALLKLYCIFKKIKKLINLIMYFYFLHPLFIFLNFNLNN